MKKLNITTATKKELQSLPLRGWNQDIGLFDSLVVLPTRRKHESGYRIIDFVAVKESEPICRLSECSDILHIGGIGGYNNEYGNRQTEAIDWTMDCLPVSGLLRIFCRRDLSCGAALSSFELFAIKEKL